jgi:hypothetical protein
MNMRSYIGLKPMILALCLLVTVSPATFGQSPSTTLRRAETALGSSKALKGIGSVVQTGTIKRLSDGAYGRYRSMTAQPNMLVTSFDVGGFEVESGFNGRSAWSRDSRDGLRTLTGAASTGMQAAAVYRNTLWLNYKQQKAKIVSAGADTIDGRPANVLVMTTPKGASIRLWFDAATGLPVRDQIGNEITEYSDYRGVDRIRRPFVMRLTTGGEAYEIKLDDVRTGADVARSQFDVPVMSGEPLPDIPTLLRELQANEDRVEKLLDTYSFTQRSIKRELGKDGVLRETESQTVQLSFHRGRRVARLIEKNGRPLNSREQAEADKDVEKRIEEIDREFEKDKIREVSGGPPDGDERRISIAEVLRASKLTNPRRERFGGRNVIVFDFEPDPNFDMKNAKSMLKFFGKTAGVMWIDEQDKQVARLEASLADNFKIGGGLVANLKKGASFVLEQERVGGEIWLPSHAEINLAVRLLLVKGISVNQVVKSYGYSKFQTEVKDAAIDAPQKP